MAEREIKDWITVNGKHVPIYEGESKEQAYNRSIAKANEDKRQSDIAKAQVERDRLNKKTNNNAESYKLSKEYSDVVDALGIRGEVDNIIKTIESTKPKLEKPHRMAPDVKSYDFDTPYGRSGYWKNPGENFYRLVGVNNRQAKTEKEALSIIKKDLISDAVIKSIKKAAYTGVSYGIGGDEYTEKGSRVKDILKKAGFFGIS